MNALSLRALRALRPFGRTVLPVTAALSSLVSCSGVSGSSPTAWGTDAGTPGSGSGSGSGGEAGAGGGSGSSGGPSGSGGPSSADASVAAADSSGLDAAAPLDAGRPDAVPPGPDAAAVDAGSSTCPAPPSTEPASSIAAVNAVNAVRVLAGVPCDTLVPALDSSALLHCNYYAANATNTACTGNAHVEVSGCTGFVAAQFSTRETMAGYSGRPSSEVMAFTGSPAQSVQTWIDSVWHRIPLLSPWIRDLGYGGTTTPARCDTIDFGGGATTPSTVTAVYPYSGQTGVLTSFDGTREGPTPPAPPSGWPSGYPVTLFLQNGTVQSHQITVDGTTAPIAHVWIDPTNTTNFPYDYILYTNTALAPNTTYRVQIAATQAGMSLSFDWKFTTGAR